MHDHTAASALNMSLHERSGQHLPAGQHLCLARCHGAKRLSDHGTPYAVLDLSGLDNFRCRCESLLAAAHPGLHRILEDDFTWRRPTGSRFGPSAHFRR